MRNLKISVEDALAIAADDEGHFLDKKALEVSGKGVQKIAVGFANSDGGELYVGIADERHQPVIKDRWQGADKPEDFNGLLQSLFDVEPTLGLTYEVLFAEGLKGFVLRISIDKSSEVHKTSGGKVYIRHGAQCLPIKNPQKIMELSFAKGAATYEDQKIETMAPEALVDSMILNNFLKDYSPKTDPLDFLVNQHLLDNSSWTPIYACVLLFYSNPSAALPRRCAVKIARYETREDDPEREHLKENVTIEGSLYKLIHESVGKVTEIMSSIEIWTTEGMKKVEYPPETIWEIVTNAIIHRDYSISDDVQITIFNDRIEILSPGKLPGYVTTTNILDSRYSRNPKVVRTLNRYADPPNKDLGEGLNTAFQKMKEWKLKPPIITEENNYVRVVIPHSPLAAPEQLVMDWLKHHKSIANSQARELTGIKSENEVKRVFLRLAKENLIERVPGLKGSASRWQKKKKG